MQGAAAGSTARRALSFGGLAAAAEWDKAPDSAGAPAAAAVADGLRFGSSAVAAAAAADYVSAPSLREKARSGKLPVSIAALEVRITTPMLVDPLLLFRYLT